MTKMNKKKIFEIDFVNRKKFFHYPFT